MVQGWKFGILRGKAHKHTVTDGYCGESTIGCCVTDGMILRYGNDRTLLNPYDHFCAKSQ